MPRIPGPARRARALAFLAFFLSRDDDFRAFALGLLEEGGDRYSEGVAQIRDRLQLPETEWANAYVSELVQHFDDPSRLSTIVRHWRPAFEFKVSGKDHTESTLVDPEGGSGSTAATLTGLEALSNAPRKARRWWTEQELPKRQQPTETLRRDVFLFYLVYWRGLNRLDAALEVDDLANAGGIRARSDRGHKRLPGGERAFEDRELSSAAVRKALNRVQRLLG